MPLHAVLALALLIPAADKAPDAPTAEPARLDLGRLYLSTDRGARVAPGIEALRGQRVRATGFMVRMEDAPRGAFYLTRHPIEAEEGGAGTGDLPPGALRVEVPHLAGEEIAWVPDVIEVVGTLEVGRAEDAEGRVSWLRVVVEEPAREGSAAEHGPARSTAGSPATTSRR